MPSCDCARCRPWQRALEREAVALRAATRAKPPPRPERPAEPEADRLHRERQAELAAEHRALVRSFGEAGWRSQYEVRRNRTWNGSLHRSWVENRDLYAVSGDAGDLERMLAAVTFTSPPDAPAAEPEPEPRFVLLGWVPHAPSSASLWLLLAVIGVVSFLLGFTLGV